MNKRVFFAQVPPPDICLEIEQWRARNWPNLSRPVAVQNFHLTVAFLGSVDAEKLNQLMDDVQGIDFDVVELALDQVGYWSKPDVLWLGTSAPPEEMVELAKKCKRLANRVGIKVESGKFTPHISLARRLDLPPPAALVEPDFNVELDHLSLVESTLHPAGSQYRELASWYCSV